jgi:hypothetical protein
MENSSPKTIEALPEEIKITILKTLADPTTLNSLVSTSHSFYRSYITNRESTFRAILGISLDLLPETIYLQEARKLKRGPNWSADLRNLLAGYRTSRILIEPLHIDNLRCAKQEDVLKIAEVHSVVEAFTEEFCKKILTTTDETEYPALTKTETRRIHRAIYRFEIFGELFHYIDPRLDPDWCTGDDFSAESFAELFLSYFEPWEVEEIACIRDFIFEFYRRSIEECMPEIAKLDRLEEMACLGYNDPTCDNFNCPRGALFHFPCIFALAKLSSSARAWIEYDAEKFLALGLEWLMGEIMGTTCVVTRARSLHEDHLLGMESGRDFLTEALKVIPGDWYPRDRQTPKIEEADWSEDGASAGWHLSTKDLNEEYFEARKAGLREQGYVMWDLSRLKGWHSLGLACESSIQTEKSRRSTFLGRRL